MSSPETRKRCLETSNGGIHEETPSDRSKRISLSPPSNVAVPTPSETSGTAPSNVSKGAGNSEDCDDEVEFLYTLSPESALQQTIEKIGQTRPSSRTTSKDSELDTTSNDGGGNDKVDTVTRGSTPAPENYAASPVPTNSISGPPQTLPTFSHRSSAYLQTLAEICHTILWDGRWRVGGKAAQSLFAWERGEDLSAVQYLARRYLPRKSTKLLASTNGTDETEKADYSGVDNFEDEDDLDRCLETYCRLYFRKGPWFRLDNLYTSYYLPKRERQPNLEQSNAKQSPKKPLSPSRFFFPASQRTKQQNFSEDKKMEAYIDQDYVHRQLEAVQVMLDDIKELNSLGLIRFFHTEEECGKTVGNTDRYQTSSSILRQDEQRSILAMLGGKNRKRPSPSATSSGSDKSFSFNNSNDNGPRPSENFIWKQMCQQQTIFKSFTNNSSSDECRILPVAKHVHRILVEKWAAAIVVKASKVEYLPSAIHRQATRAVGDKLMQWTADKAFGGDILTMMCCRLREAPVETLRRVCRLYLCATSGPGDMRGDGTNAWRSLPDKYPHKDFRNLPMRTNNVPPPGSHSWHMVSYPGKDWRMRLSGFSFVDSFVPLTVADAEVTNQVFSSVKSFHQWEAGVELRANGDFLLELNDLILYTQRKQARINASKGVSSVNIQNNDNTFDSESDLSRGDEKCPQNENDIDFLDLLAAAGRENLFRQFLDEHADSALVLQQIEKEVSALLCTGKLYETNTGTQGRELRCQLGNECEKILAVTAILLIHILEIRNATASQSDISRIAERPWLRHLHWEGCLAYLLWDMIPILERRGYYTLSIDSLEVLLFGKRLVKGELLVPESLVAADSQKSGSFFLANFYLSRRARGKAYERLIIDYIHILRKSYPAKNYQKKPTPKGKRKSKVTKKQETPCTPSPQEMAMQLTRQLIQSRASETGRITFAAIRTLARRLKCPLSHTLYDLKLYETQELGHRLSNGSSKGVSNEKYSDWIPVVDTTTANAISNDSSGPGSRCAYVGFEEDEQNTVYIGSLNVEELAMEYYQKGRLPVAEAPAEVPAAKGWKGYHDEGGRLRALFRILSSETLGMDWASSVAARVQTQDLLTIHLTPFQSAPFDLHVGAELRSIKSFGFYQRRRQDIDLFLKKLASLDAQAVGDLVYDSINRRFQHVTSSNHFDPSIERDILQVRTLSMLACGFGGRMLASVFRCFFFDYRHYSGGLPDLTLFRAVYDSGELVDLGEWVGETFSSDYQASLNAEQAANIFGDRDEEFLGCAKVGDSGARNSSRWGRSTRRIASSGPSCTTTLENGPKRLSMPNRLLLEHNGWPVKVECMCVEVKSQNDRLDPRQEDWLNILSLHGNARVCKFEKPRKENPKNGKEKQAKGKLPTKQSQSKHNAKSDLDG